MTLYVVGSVEKSHEIEVLGQRTKLDLIWAGNQIGALPVFKSKVAAQRYAGERFQVFKVEVVKG